MKRADRHLNCKLGKPVWKQPGVAPFRQTEGAHTPGCSPSPWGASWQAAHVHPRNGHSITGCLSKILETNAWGGSGAGSGRALQRWWQILLCKLGDCGCSLNAYPSGGIYAFVSTQYLTRQLTKLTNVISDFRPWFEALTWAADWVTLNQESPWQGPTQPWAYRDEKCFTSQAPELETTSHWALEPSTQDRKGTA